MVKMKIKASAAPAGNATNTENLRKQHRKEKKKKWFWRKKMKHAEKKTQEVPKAVGELPPKSPEQISANWKALQELLKQKTTVLDSAGSTSSSHPTKKPSLREGGHVPKTPKINGTGRTLEQKPAKKTKKSQAKMFVHPVGSKPEKFVNGKNPPQVLEDKKVFKQGKRKGEAERKQRDIKHKKRKTEEQPEPKPLDIWFDDVDPEDIEAALGPEAANIARRNQGIPEHRPQEPSEDVLVKEKAFEGLTKAVAMDCEMVGVGPKGEDSIVARVSIVNIFGKCIYDKYVKPTEKVTDYRTDVSGIRPANLKQGEDFKVVQKEVADILKGRVLVGHALHNDLKILFLDHPKKKIRDTQKYKPFRQQVKSGRPSLKLLCEKLLNVKVQTSEHSSVQDAQAAMRLYTMAKKQWEASLKEKSKAKKE